MKRETQITRYSQEDIVTDGDEQFYEIKEPLDITAQDTDEIYYVKTGDTLRGLAFQMYMDARLWWVIAEFNDIIDPFEDIVVGTPLRCPSLSRVRSQIV